MKNSREVYFYKKKKKKRVKLLREILQNESFWTLLKIIKEM